MLLMAGSCKSAIAASTDLVIGHVGPFSGALSMNAESNYAGSKACFDQVNAHGGIAGRQIRLVREDDAYKPEETVRLLRVVAKRDKPLAFVNLLGSATGSEVLKSSVLSELAIPVVGVTPGLDSLREPGSPHFFHLHASDNAQLNAILQHLAIFGLKRIAVIHMDTRFGVSGLTYIEKQAPTLGMSVVAKAAIPQLSDNTKEGAKVLHASSAQAYIMVLAPHTGGAFVRDIRALGGGTPIYGMSYVAVDVLVATAGLASATGVALAQVTPNPNSQTTGLMRDFHSALKQFGPKDATPSSMSLQGYLAARVVVEALRRSGGTSSAAMQRALGSLRTDFGGYTIDFTDGGNVGSRKVDFGVVDRNGVLRY